VEDIRVERIEATPVVDPPRIWLNAGRDNDYTGPSAVRQNRPL